MNTDGFTASGLATALWAVLAISGIVLVVVWAMWHDYTRRTDTNLGRDDIAAVCARRKGVAR